MQALLKSFFSIFMAIVLVGSMCPMVAYAQPSQENSIEEEANNQDSAELEDGQAVDTGDSSEQINGEKQQDEHESESVDQSLVSEETVEEQDAQDPETDVDPDAENSWRYSNGEIITSSEGANPDTADLNSGIMPFAMVENPAGYKVFNWFDKFNNGYYTGTNAYKGIDVSYHNGNIDWAKVKASGVDYAIIRCGYGMDQRDQDDEKWLENVQGCIENNIPFGVYLYSYATNTSRASSEADHVLRLLREAGLDPSDVSYPVYFDMEDVSTLNSDHAAIATTFCNKIEAAGYVAGVYSSTSWFNDRLTDPCFSNWTKWVAQWNASIGLTYDGLSDFSSGNGMWQFSDYGSVPGISGAVDLNYTCMEPGNALQIEDAFEIPDSPYETPIANGDYVINTALSPTSVLDIRDGSKEDGARTQIYISNGTDAQRFTLESDPITGYYKIANIASGKMLGLQRYDNGNYGSTVAQYSDYSNNDSCKWIIVKNLNGSFTIKNAVNTNYVLDVANGSVDNGTPVRMYANNGSAAQKFYFLTKSDVMGSKTVDDGLYEIQNANSGKILDIENGSTASGANCQQYVSNGTAAQKFKVEYDGAGFYTITNLKSGKLLEVSSAAPVLSANVQQGDISSSDTQKWAITDNGDGTYKIISKATGLVLDIANASKQDCANVDAYVDNGTAAQKFVFVSKKEEKTIEDGDYVVVSSLSGGKVLDITDGSQSNGALVQLYQSNGTAAQSFHFTYDNETGFYTIINKKSGKALDLPDASTANGTHIQQYISNGTLAQQWVITESNGSYQIASALDTKKCLDLPNAATANGTKIQLYTANGTAAQRFEINGV